MLADYHYSYDGNGNRICKEGLTGSTSYQYDMLNRLVKVQYPKGLEEFTYDKADNRLTEKQTRRLFESMAGVSENTGSGIKPENTATVPQGANRAAASQPSTKHQKDISQSRER